MQTLQRNPEGRSGTATRESPFLRNAWYLVTWTSDLPKRDLIAITVMDQPIVLFRPESGGWAALEDICCHRLVPLSLGRREQDCIRCMYHGLKFDADGHCVEIPGEEHVSPAVRVRAYAARECRGALWVWMGRPEFADVAQIPLIPGMDQPSYDVACSFIDIECNASLIWDNLNDLSHVPFVHSSSFAGNDPVVIASMLAGEQEMEREVTERGVRSTKWHAHRSHAFLSQPCDDFLTAEFIAPGALLMTTRSYKVGTKGPIAGALPEAELLWLRVASQVVTPVSETRSRIFFTMGNWRESKELLDRQMSVAEAALAEDKRFMDAQQAMMDRMPHRTPMSLSMDVGVVRFRAVMKRLREMEIAAGE